MKLLYYIFIHPVLRSLQFVLIVTDGDYRRFKKATDIAHSVDGYWRFVRRRMEEERNPDLDDPEYVKHDRWDAKLYETSDEDSNNDEDEDPAENDENEQANKPPSDLEKAEGFLGLLGRRYDRTEYRSAKIKLVKNTHPDNGGSEELMKLVNNACDTIEQHHGWK